MYQPTALPIDAMSLPQLRDPVLTDQRPDAFHGPEDTYRGLAMGWAEVRDDIHRVVTAAHAAHSGRAAEAAAAHLRALADPGDAAVTEASRAADALREQATYTARVHREMATADPGFTLPGWVAAGAQAVGAALPPLVATTSAVQAYAASDSAEHAAAHTKARDELRLYETNTNANLGAGFVAFAPPELPAGGGEPAAGVGLSGAGAAPGLSGAADGLGGRLAPAAGGDDAAPSGGLPPGGANPSGGLPAGGGHGTAAPNGTMGNGALPPGSAGPTALHSTAGPTLPPGTGPAGYLPGPFPPGGSGRAASAPRAGGMPYPDGRSRIPFGVARPGMLEGTRPGTGQGAPDARAGGPRGAGPPPPTADMARTGAQRAGGAAPFIPASVAGRGDDTHERPPWLLEDDPDAFWFAGLPDHTDPVIGRPDPG